MICEGCNAEVYRAKLDLDSGKWFCHPCHPGVGGTPNVPGSNFPFVTANLTGKPVQVNSLRHLRQLESSSGVHSVAFNQNSTNFDIPPRGR